jgi:hypothetical protein
MLVDREDLLMSVALGKSMLPGQEGANDTIEEAHHPGNLQ